LAATISRSADRWFVSFTCEVQRMIPVDNGNLGVVGVDVGVRHLAVLSTGMVVPNPRALERSLRKLRRLNRELTRRRPNSRRRKSTGRRLARVHLRAANLRRDALHKLTTTLATEDSTVVVAGPATSARRMVPLYVKGRVVSPSSRRRVGRRCPGCGWWP